MLPSLRITEIFYSIQGESLSVGLPTIFIRLTGCPLRCSYCDTSYAFSGGKLISIEQILKDISAYDTKYITVTGGEPLAQPNCIQLLSKLCDFGYIVSLETSGALDISTVDTRVIKVMDIKTPSSLESAKNLDKNLNAINTDDQLKFVIGDREDYDWSVEYIKSMGLSTEYNIMFSPSHGVLAAATLADWILTDNLQVRLQIQLHKYLWGDVPGR